MTELAKNAAGAAEGAGEAGAADGARRSVVLQVLPALVTGGVERGAVDVAAAVTAAGGRAIVVSAGGPMTREVERGGAVHVTLPVDSKNPIVMRGNIARLEAVIEKYGVDVVHARSRAPAWSALAAARRTGRAFVTTFHGTYGHSNAVKRLYNSVMTRGDAVIAISEFIADHVRRVYHVAGPRVHVIHRGIDTKVFSPEDVSAERVIQLAEQWRLTEGLPVVMLPGRLARWKGHTLLIEALALLGRDDIRCLVVGSDQGRRRYRGEIERLVAQRGLAHVVQITGHCRDMAAAYMLADVVVSASTDPEAFGRVAAEAQAMGCPVVASDHGAARETVLPGRTGWLFTPGDPAALARAIDEALALGADRRERLAEEAKTHIRASFTRERMCAETLAVYEKLLHDEGGAPAGAP